MPKFTLPRRIEAEYQTSMFKLMAAITPKPTTDVDAWVNELAKVGRRLDVLEIASKIAHRMATQVNIENERTWRLAAHRSNRSQMLYRALQQELQGSVGVKFRQILTDNARLISSVPVKVSASLASQIAKGQQQGMRPETVAKAMRQQFTELTKGRVQMIARTQVAMANSTLTMARCEEMNLPWFEWDSSVDQRVRPSHRNLNGVLCSWNDLPSPEALINVPSTLGRCGPGMCPNCRCVPGVLLSVDDVSWPRRVYTAGRIQTMSRAQFQKFTGIPDRVAA